MAPGSAPSDELLGKALLYKTYREFALDKDPHGAARFGIFSKTDLEMFRYVDGHPEVQHVFAAAIAHQQHAKELDAGQARMWSDGSIATREHHQKQLDAWHVTSGLHAVTSNLLGAAGMHIGQLYHPDDLGKQVALAGAFATAGEMMLVTGEIVHGAEHAGRHLPNPGGPLYAPGTKAHETPFEKKDLLPGHQTYSPHHAPDGEGHGGGHGGGHAPHHLNPDSDGASTGAPDPHGTPDPHGVPHTPSDANFLDAQGHPVVVTSEPAAGEHASYHAPDSSVPPPPSHDDPSAVASPPEANYTGPHGQPEYFDPDSTSQSTSSHSSDVAPPHHDQAPPHHDPDSSAPVSESHQTPADWHANEATQQSVVDTDADISH